MDNANTLPDPLKVFDALKRHACAYDYGCWNHHDGEIYDKCPYFGTGPCVKDSSADAVTVLKILLANQSESSPYFGVKIPSKVPQTKEA